MRNRFFNGRFTLYLPLFSNQEISGLTLTIEEKDSLLTFEVFMHDRIPLTIRHADSFETIEWIKHLAKHQIPLWIRLGSYSFKMIPSQDLDGQFISEPA